MPQAPSHYERTDDSVTCIVPGNEGEAFVTGNRHKKSLMLAGNPTCKFRQLADNDFVTSPDFLFWRDKWNLYSNPWSGRMSVVNSTHIWMDDRGVAWIDQTNLKVIEIALERLAHGSSVEEIVDQHKGLITLAQVHAALAHYYDYQDEFDTEIEQQLMRADQMRLQNLDSPGRIKLKQLGRI